MSRKFYKILHFSLIAASLDASLAMEVNEFTAFDCKEGYKIGNIFVLELNFVGDSLKLLPSDDDVLSITASGSDEGLKSLQFDIDRGILKLRSKPIPRNNATLNTSSGNFFTSNTGNIFTQNYSFGGCSFTQTQYVSPQNNEPVDIAKHLNNSNCVSSMMGGLMSTGGLTLQNFASHNNKFISGTIVRGKMLLNGVVYPTGAKFENGRCVYNPGESVSEESSKQTSTPLTLQLTIKMPITLPTTLNVSAQSLFIEELAAPLSLTLNGNCISSIGTLTGDFVGALHGHSNLTIQQYRGLISFVSTMFGHSILSIQDYEGGASFSCNTDGHSSLSISSAAESPIGHFSGTTHGHSKIMINTPITKLKIEGDGHSTATFTKPISKIERKSISGHAKVNFK